VDALFDAFVDTVVVVVKASSSAATSILSFLDFFDLSLPDLSFLLDLSLWLFSPLINPLVDASSSDIKSLLTFGCNLTDPQTAAVWVDSEAIRVAASLAQCETAGECDARPTQRHAAQPPPTSGQVPPPSIDDRDLKHCSIVGLCCVQVRHSRALCVALHRVHLRIVKVRRQSIERPTHVRNVSIFAVTLKRRIVDHHVVCHETCKQIKICWHRVGRHVSSNQCHPLTETLICITS
jgi:hypothetical protein